MPIVSSSHILGSIQKDGRRYVSEDHVDQFARHHLVEYLAAIGADYVAIRMARAAAIGLRLIEDEIAAALLVDANPTLEYATKNDFVPVLRDAYRRSERGECARLATWIIDRVNAGWVTEAQVQSAFGFADGPWATLRAKMIALRANYLAVQAAAGE